MADHEHEHDEGAHEVDKMPSGKLFNLLFGLSALTLMACIGVVQLFHRQVDTMQAVRDAKLPTALAQYREEMADLENNWGPVAITDDDGVPESEGGKGVHEAKRIHMPLVDARKRVLEEPDKYFKAAQAYRGWRDPDPNAPKANAPTRPRPPGARAPGARGPVRVPARPGAKAPGAPAAPAGAKAPAPTEERKAPAKPEGKAPAPAEGKAPAKPEGKAPAKREGKAPAGEPKGAQ